PIARQSAWRATTPHPSGRKHARVTLALCRGTWLAFHVLRFHPKDARRAVCSPWNSGPSSLFSVHHDVDIFSQRTRSLSPARGTLPHARLRARVLRSTQRSVELSRG